MKRRTGIAWKSVLLYGFIAAVLDLVFANIAGAVLMAIDAKTAESDLARILILSVGSLAFTLVLGYWVARKTDSRILNGFLVGVAMFVYLETPVVILTLFFNGMPPELHRLTFTTLATSSDSWAGWPAVYSRLERRE